MQREFDRVVAELSRILRERGLQAHTKLKGGSLIIVKRRPKRSRLTGEPR